MPAGPLRRVTRFVRMGVLAVLSLLVVPRTARAESTTSGVASAAPSPSPEDPRSAAEDHFRRGLALAKTPGGWEAALGEFLESRRLFPTRSATRNAAIASQSLGRYADALELYDSLLRDFAAGMPETERSVYVAERRALLVHFGQLTVAASEPSVRIVVDGRERGLSPLPEPLLLQAGTHVVHAGKEGFQALDQQVFVAAGGKYTLAFEMKPVSGARILAVTEVSGESLDVVVDAATVGKAPYQGAVSAGLHSVLLRGSGRGTAPVTVDLRAQPSVALTLRAVALDAEASIRPTPAVATIYIDGELAGSGAWSGGLPSGAHRLDVIAPDHLPFRAELSLTPGMKAVVTPQLAPSRAPAPHLTGFYLEPNAGLLFGRTVRGGVDMACDCDSRSRPFGWTASLRAGYAALRHLAPELTVGYLRVDERSTRTVHAGSQPGSYGFVSHDERDSIAAAGPFLSAGAAARFFERTPVTARLSAGAALLGLSFANAGTFSGYATDPSGVIGPASGRLSIEEPSARSVVPFVATELRAGYAFDARFSVDLGVSLAAFFPPRVMREHRAGLLSGPEQRNTGVLRLPDEVAMRAFLLVSPSIAVRIEL